MKKEKIKLSAKDLPRIILDDKSKALIKGGDNPNRYCYDANNPNGYAYDSQGNPTTYAY